ncbi:M20/M25/M40 family metallo-hydrolase [Pseudonocardia yuanmonensis]|uniref:Vacuolar membrane protease n=1 Tax=Pseudonocardia yuanmonensis TaxID=1095914 RepID=A0ABP8WBU1_9PSEU
MPRPLAPLLAWLLVLAAGVVAVVTILPPAPEQDPRAAGPSAARAFADVERIAVTPHVTGSPANDAVREYVLTSLRDMGFAPRVQDTIGVNAGSPGAGTAAAARVGNVITTVPGTAPTGRVFVVAHHDSVQSGPGANDDGAGTATLLEAARWLRTHPPRNDVVLVSTDAEEACLCGAEAFVAEAPEAADGGVVLNVEARGTSGPVTMFETTPGNGAVVREFAAAAPHPVATSFAVEVYRILPNDTDFSPFRDAGRFTGLNSAYIDGSAAYHGPLDVPARMDLGSLQMHLDNTTALVSRLGAADLAGVRAPSADATYFPVAGLLVRYPDGLVLPLAVLAVLVVGAAAVTALRRGATTGRRLLAGTAAALVPLVAAAALAQLAWLGLTALRPGYAGLRDPWEPQWDRAALACLVAAVALAWFALLRRRVGTTALAIGGLVWLAVLGVVLAVAAPGGSYLTALPALAGGVAGIVGGRLATAAAGAVAALVLVPTAVLFLPALGLSVAAVPAFVMALLGLALVPLLDLLPPRRLVPAVALSAALVLGVAGFARNAFDAARPAPSQLMYLLDADAHTARWLSAEPPPGPWTAGYVDGREELDLAGFDGTYTTGPAAPADLPPTTVAAVREGRTVTARLTPQRPVRFVALRTQGAIVTRPTSRAGRCRSATGASTCSSTPRRPRAWSSG